MHPRRYETLILLAPNLPPEDLEAFQKKIDTIMSAGGGEMVRFDDWGRRRLSYPVKKELYGHYQLFDFQGTPELVTELERNFKIDEKVFKYLTLVLSKKFTNEELAEVREKLLADAARREAEKAKIKEAAALASADKKYETSSETSDNSENFDKFESYDKSDNFDNSDESDNNQEEGV